MITLVICNCQSDFIAGTMCKKSTKSILPVIKTFIKENKNNIDKIIFTIDWHPYNHCSFKKNGGNLPIHCVQDTPGACIEPKLLKYIQSLNINYDVDRLGIYEDLEEHGAFKDILSTNDILGKRYYFDNILVNPDSDIVLCGINENDSIREIINNLKIKSIYPKILVSGITSLENEEKLYKFIKEKGIEKI